MVRSDIQHLTQQAVNHYYQANIDEVYNKVEKNNWYYQVKRKMPAE